MAVYVDNAFIEFKAPRAKYKFKMCHMIADTEEELHAMADKLGMKRQWFQDTKYPHYDVTKTNRAKALELGAVPVSVKELLTIATMIDRKQNVV